MYSNSWINKLYGPETDRCISRRSCIASQIIHYDMNSFQNAMGKPGNLSSRRGRLLDIPQSLTICMLLKHLLFDEKIYMFVTLFEMPILVKVQTFFFFRNTHDCHNNKSTRDIVFCVDAIYKMYLFVLTTHS